VHLLLSRTCSGFATEPSSHNRLQLGRLCVPPATDISAQIGQRNSGRAAQLLVSLSIFQNHLNFLKVFLMRQTEIAAFDFPPVAAPTFTRAAIRFVASFAALIGVSLLLASL
jgi:hypothetical protein